MAEKCPKCGADFSDTCGDPFNISLTIDYLRCDSHRYSDGRFYESSICKGRQISQLEATVAELQIENERLKAEGKEGRKCRMVLDAIMPELTDEDRAAIDALPADFVTRIWNGERWNFETKTWEPLETSK